MKKLSDSAEEILEFLWIEGVERNRRADLHPFNEDIALQELITKGLIDTEADNILTDEGYKEARNCVRRHRLAERLLSDILDVRGKLLHDAGCKFEHGLHSGIENNICTLLGHPRTCPHGKPIPEGDCCKNMQGQANQIIISLKDLKPGNQGKVAYINTQDKDILKKLLSMGVLPGNDIILTHRFPSYIFNMGDSTFAIDKDLAEYIHVLVL